MDLNEIVDKVVTNVLESYFPGSNELRIEDYFDISKISKKDIKDITNDMTVFLQGNGFSSLLTNEGEIFIKEENVHTLPIKQLRQELKKLGYKQWQIISKVAENKVRVVILLPEINRNLTVLENEMLTFGWSKARVSGPVTLHGIQCRAMEFDPMVQKSLSSEARRFPYLYHITPSHNINSILTKGLEPRSENLYLSYTPKVHLIKGNIHKHDCAQLGWMLYSCNPNVADGKYTVLRIDMSKLDDNIDFYGDSRFKFGYYTNATIPPSAIEIYARVKYKDKRQYNGEELMVVNDNDTMI